MATYIILSRFSPEAFDDPKHFIQLAEQVSKKIKRECPGERSKGRSSFLCPEAGRGSRTQGGEQKDAPCGGGIGKKSSPTDISLSRSGQGESKG